MRILMLSILALTAPVFMGGCAHGPASTVPGVSADSVRDYERGVARYREGEYAAAVESFDKVLAAGPYPDPRGVWLHAYAALAAGNADRAVELGDNLLGAASSRSESYEFAAIARLFKGDPVSALAALRRASELEGKGPRQWTYRALAYDMLGQAEERRLACQKGDNDFAATIGNRPDDVLLQLERATLLAHCGTAPEQLARTLAVVREQLPKMDAETAMVPPKRIQRFTLPVLEGVSSAAKGEATAAAPLVADALNRGNDVPRFDRAEAYYLAMRVAQAANMAEQASKWEAEGKSLDPKGPFFGVYVKPTTAAPVPPAVKIPKPRKPSSIEEEENMLPYPEREDG